jgi:polysaccharide export outer membrane protein
LICRNVFIAVMFAGLTLSGCTAEPSPLSAADANTPYLLGPGDKIRVTVYNETAMTGEYSVTPDGEVSFPLIGNVPASGHTIADVQNELLTALSNGYVKDPKVSVEVSTYRSFYILGQVNKPGEYPYVAGLTVDQAIATAGGFTYRANEHTVFLRRSHGSERSVKLRSLPPVVMPGDTIRVGQRYF